MNVYRYMGITIWPSGNMNGLRWYSLTGDGMILKADSIQSMRALIRHHKRRTHHEGITG